MASISEKHLANGEVRYRVRWQESGRYRERTVDTRSEAETLASEIERAKPGPRRLLKHTGEIPQSMDMFLASLTRSETGRAYERALRQLLAWHHDTQAHEFTTCPTHEELHDFAGYLEESGLSDASVAAKLTAISGWLAHSVSSIGDNPALGVRAWPTKPPEADPWGDSMAGSEDAEFCWQCGKWRRTKYFDVEDGRQDDRQWCRDCERRDVEIEDLIETGPRPENYSTTRLFGPESKAEARQHREAVELYQAQVQSVWARSAVAKAEYEEASFRWREDSKAHRARLRRLIVSLRVAWYGASTAAVAVLAVWVDGTVAFWAAIGGLVAWALVVRPIAESFADRRLSSKPGPSPRPGESSWERIKAIPEPAPLPEGPAGLTAARWARICSFFGGCAYCGERLPSPEQYQIEHVVPFSLGGDHAIENVVPACRYCNLWKATLSGERFVHRLERTERTVNPRWYEWADMEDRSIIWADSVR